MTRGYNWDGKEFLCTGVSVKIDNEKGLITVDIDGEASTWGPEGVAGEYPYDPPAGNPPSDNPGGYWPVWPPPYGEEPGDVPPWAEEGEGSIWPITVYLPLWSGHVVRGVGLGPSVRWQNRCTWANLGQVHSDGIYWMALDQFNPVNVAMVATRHRIYRTTNLADDSPTWELVYGPVLATTEITAIESSSVQQGLWMAAGYAAAAPTNIHVWQSINGGDTWAETTFSPGLNPYSSATALEMSVHDADRAWVMWADEDARCYIGATDDMWASQSFTFIPVSCFNSQARRPSLHHREYDNSNDSEVLYGSGEYQGGPGNDYARIYKDGVCVTFYSTTADRPYVSRVGCGAGTLNRWWALASDDDGEVGFWVSDDGITAWTKQSDWGMGTGNLLDSRDCRNMSRDWQSYVVTRDGVAYPVRLTTDRGVTWYQQTGGVGSDGWTAFLTAEGLGDPDVMCVCSPSLLP